MAKDTALTTRRGLLTGAVALAGCPYASLAATADQSHVADAPVADAASGSDVVLPFGPHQAGITTPRPANAMIASFHVLADDPAALESLLRRLTDRIAFLTQGGPVKPDDPKLPPPDSGLLGPVIQPDGLTITVALGSSLFDDRPWLADQKPRVLQRMTQFSNDALIADLTHGDLAIQFCANRQDTVVHALRDILKSVPDQLVIKWMQAGNVPVVAAAPGKAGESARNLLGFRDGSANPDNTDDTLMNKVVWAGAHSHEPDWAAGGSYMVVRLIRNTVERWDRTSLAEQERIIGRSKMTGAPLDAAAGTERSVPDFGADPDGKLTKLDAHIRLANPRTPEAQTSLMLRRPFNYVNGVLANGHLDQGLLFIAWQADLEASFITVQRRLNGEPLEEYIKPVGGGYFFALPGYSDTKGDYLGRTLILAISSTSQG